MNSELEEITFKAAGSVGDGILGIDLMEDPKRGYLVHEINNTVEFRPANCGHKYVKGLSCESRK